MEVRVMMIAACVSLGLAVAQVNPQDQQSSPQKQTTTPQTQTTAPQTATPQSTAPQTTTPTQATPQSNAPSGTNTPATASSGSATPSQMQTKTYKGVLVDMSCASKASLSTTPNTQSQQPADQNSANRAASDGNSSCQVSSSTTELGMKMNDGRTVRFDLVGNQRAQDSLKNDKHWSKDLSAGKPIHATVIGVLNGDKMIVSSIR